MKERSDYFNGNMTGQNAFNEKKKYEDLKPSKTDNIKKKEISKDSFPKKETSKLHILAPVKKDGPLLEKTNFNFQEIYDIVAQNEEKMKVNEKELVIFLGISQCGKSTTINSLRGAKFEPDGIFLSVKKESNIQNLAKMGGKDGISTTKIPDLYQFGDNIVLLDTQGLCDTNEDKVIDKYEVSGSYLIQMAIESAKSVRCICVINCSDFFKGIVKINDIGKFIQNFFSCVPKENHEFVPIHFLFNQFHFANFAQSKMMATFTCEQQNEYIKYQIVEHLNFMIEGVRKNPLKPQYPYLKMISDNIYSDNFSYFDPTNDESIEMLKNRLLNLKPVEKKDICIDKYSKRRQRFENEFYDKVQSLTIDLKKSFISIKYPHSLFNKMISLIDEKINLLNNNIEAMSNFKSKSTMNEIQSALLNKISKDFDDDYKDILKRNEEDLNEYQNNLERIEREIISFDELGEIFNDSHDEANFFFTNKYTINYPNKNNDSLPIEKCDEELGPDTQKKFNTFTPFRFHGEYEAGGLGTRIEMAIKEKNKDHLFNCLRCSVFVKLYAKRKNIRENIPVYNALLAEKDQTLQIIEERKIDMEKNFDMLKQNIQQRISEKKNFYISQKEQINQKYNSLKEVNNNNVKINKSEIQSCINIATKLKKNLIPIDEMKNLKDQIDHFDENNKNLSDININDIDSILDQFDIDYSIYKAFIDPNLNINSSNSNQNEKESSSKSRIKLSTKISIKEAKETKDLNAPKEESTFASSLRFFDELIRKT